MALEAGSVFARLGGRFDDSGFDEFDRRVDRSRQAARNPVEQRLGGDVDGAGFALFDRLLGRSKTQAATPVRAKLTADVDRRAFEAYERELQKARASAARRDTFKAQLGADFDEGAFKAYERELNRADKATMAAAAAGGGAGRLTLMLGGLGGAAGRVGALMAPLIPIGVALAGALTAIAGSALAAVGGLAAVGTGAAAALSPIAALAAAVTQRVGLIGEAWKALQAAEEGAGAAATSSADAQRAAAQAIEGAERQQAEAHRGVQRAQEDLTAARFRARREVEDLERAVSRSALSEERASLTLDQALARLAELRADPATSLLELRDAQLAVREAQASLRDARLERNRALTDAKRGTDTVRDAQRQLTDARRGAAEAADAVADAQDNAARATQRQSAAADNAAAALGKLTAVERRVLEGVRKFTDELRAMFAPATDAIFGGVADALDRLTPALDQFAGGFERLGERIGGIIRKAAAALAGPEWTGAFRAFLRTAERIVEPLSNAFGSIFVIVRNVARAALPFVEDFARALERTFGGLAAKTNDAERMAEVVESLVRHTRSWGRLLGELGETLFLVFGGGADSGRGMVDGMADSLDRFNDKLRTPEGKAELKRFFADAALLASDVVKALGTIADAVLDVSRLFARLNYHWHNFEDTVENGAAVIGLALRHQFFNAADAILGTFTQIMGGFSSMLSALGKVPGFGWAKDAARAIDDARDSMDGFRESIRKAAEEDRWEARMDRQQDKVDSLKRKLKTLDKGSQEYKDTQRDLEEAQGRANNTLEEGQDAGYKAARGYKRAGEAAESAKDASYDAGRLIAASFNTLAEQFGMDPVKFNAARTKALRGADGQPNDPGGGGGPTRRYGGGMANPASSSGADDHLLFDPSGRPVAALSGTEGIVNRPQMGIIDAALGIASSVTGGALPGSLDGLWGMGLRHFAGGGSIVRVPGSVRQAGAEYANRSVIDEILRDARRYPALTLMDAYGPGHSSPGHTVTGTAADWSGPDAVMDRMVRDLVARGYLVGYDGRFGSQDWPGHGPSTRTPNFHLHVEYGTKGARGGGGGGAAELTIPRVLIGGPKSPARTLAQKTADRLRRGAQGKLDDVAVAALGDPRPGGRAAPGDSNVVAAFRRAIRTAGATPVERLALWEAGLVESNLTNVPAGQGDRDSVGALQQRPSQGWRGLGNPYRAALEFLSHARGLRPWRGSAGTLAQAIQRSAYPERYDQARARAMRYMAAGGRLARFAGGGKLTGKLNAGRATPQQSIDRVLGTLPRLQAARVPAYRKLETELAGLQGDYSRQERRFSFSEEDLLADDGTVDVAAVNARVREFDALIELRERIVTKLQDMRQVAERIVKSFKTILDRLRRARKRARGSARQSAYDGAIGAYETDAESWTETLARLDSETIPNAVLDVDQLKDERDDVKGTKPTARAETGRPSLEDVLGAERTGELSLITRDQALAGLTEDTGDDEAVRKRGEDFWRGVLDNLMGSNADPELVTEAATNLRGFLPQSGAAGGTQTAQAVAEGVYAALQAFNAARSDLFTSFGSNFSTGGVGIGGVRNFGAAGAGDLLGTGHGGIPAQSGGGAKVVVADGGAFVRMDAPPEDPFTWAHSAHYELENV